MAEPSPKILTTEETATTLPPLELSGGAIMTVTAGVPWKEQPAFPLACKFQSCTFTAQIGLIS